MALKQCVTEEPVKMQVLGANGTDPVGLSRALGIFVFGREAQVIALWDFQELMLPASRWRGGGLLLVPFILTLASGRLTSVRPHGALIEGWCLEGRAAVRSGSRLCCEHHPIWPHVKPNRLTRSADHRPVHSCPAPTAPSPSASAPAKPTVLGRGPSGLAGRSWQPQLMAFLVT